MEIHWPLEQARFSNLDDLQAGARTQCKRPQGRVGHEHRAERCRGRCGARYPFPESNRDRIEGLPEQYYVKPEPKFTAVERIAHAEAYFASTRADIRYRGGQAYYAQELDYIQMPPIEAFTDAESFYGTLAHEACHWTKHKSRL